jgi:hypothetical protein
MRQTRDSEIFDEILDLFARNIELRKQGAQNDGAPDDLHAELLQVEKRLSWDLLPKIFPAWGPWAPSPADDCLDGECFVPQGHYLHAVWPELQQGRRALLLALAEKRGKGTP